MRYLLDFSEKELEALALMVGVGIDGVADHAPPLAEAAHAVAEKVERACEKAAPRYALDGEEVDFHEFLAANVDGLSEEEVESLRNLDVGESITFGGGAAPSFRISRTR